MGAEASAMPGRRPSLTLASPVGSWDYQTRSIRRLYAVCRRYGVTMSPMTFLR